MEKSMIWFWTFPLFPLVLMCVLMFFFGATGRSNKNRSTDSGGVAYRYYIFILNGQTFRYSRKHGFTSLFYSSVLPEGCACQIENHSGVVTLKPVPGNVCMVSDRQVTEPCRLAQGKWHVQFFHAHTVCANKGTWGYTVCLFSYIVVLPQGAVITFGRLHKFRFNHPAEAAVLRERRRVKITYFFIIHVF